MPLCALATLAEQSLLRFLEVKSPRQWSTVSLWEPGPWGLLGVSGAAPGTLGQAAGLGGGGSQTCTATCGLMHHKVWAAQGLAPQHSGRWCGGQADLAPELRSGGTHHALTHRAALSHAAAWALSPGLLAAALPPRLRMRGWDSWGSVGRPWLWGALRPHQGAKAGSVAPGTRLGPAVPGAAFVSPQVLAGHLGHSRGLAGTAALAPCQPRHVGPSARQPLVPGPGAGPSGPPRPCGCAPGPAGGAACPPGSRSCASWGRQDTPRGNTRWAWHPAVGVTGEPRAETVECPCSGPEALGGRGGPGPPWGLRAGSGWERGPES